MKLLQMANQFEDKVAVENPDNDEASESSSGEGSGSGSSDSVDKKIPDLFGPFHRPGNPVLSPDKLVSISSTHQSEKLKRKNLRKVQDSVVSDAAIDAQQREKERLDRLALKRPTVSCNS